MRSYQIQDIRDFMKKLLIGDVFDTFLLSEASVTTYASFHIDGTFHPGYLGQDEAELLTAEKCGYTLWKRIRPFLLEIMKGKNTPLSFRIVFRLAQHNTESLVARCGVSLRAEDVDGLFLNLGFDGSALTCTSGISLRIFSLDKSLDFAWDEMLEKFFRRAEIPFC